MHSKLLTAARAAIVLAVTGSILAAAGCGAGGYSTMLTAPEEGKMLLIGGIILENVGYNNKQEAYTSGIEVSFMADQEIEGKVVRKSITVFGDDDGYFCVENVPHGQYALKGIRAYTPGGDWTIWNELRLPNERWAVAPATYYYPFTGTYFPVSPVGNVYNFHWNIFSVLPGQEVRQYVAAELDGDSFNLSETYTRPLVVEHFLEKYPDSGWTPILTEMLPENRRPPRP